MILQWIPLILLAGPLVFAIIYYALADISKRRRPPVQWQALPMLIMQPEQVQQSQPEVDKPVGWLKWAACDICRKDTGAYDLAHRLYIFPDCRANWGIEPAPRIKPWNSYGLYTHGEGGLGGWS